MENPTPEEKIFEVIKNLKKTTPINDELIESLKNAVELFSGRGRELDALMNGPVMVSFSKKSPFNCSMPIVPTRPDRCLKRMTMWL